MQGGCWGWSGPLSSLVNCLGQGPDCLLTERSVLFATCIHINSHYRRGALETVRLLSRCIKKIKCHSYLEHSLLTSFFCNVVRSLFVYFLYFFFVLFDLAMNI